MELIKFIFSDFFIWTGFIIIGSIILNFILKCWNRLLWYLSIMKAGWPPEHIDTDNNWKTEPKEE